MSSIAIGVYQLLQISRFKKPLLIVDDSANSQMLTFHTSHLWNSDKNLTTASKRCQEQSHSRSSSAQSQILSNESYVDASEKTNDSLNYSQGNSCQDDIPKHRLQVIKISKGLQQREVSRLPTNLNLCLSSLLSKTTVSCERLSFF
jgi:hypothetical protein